MLADKTWLRRVFSSLPRRLARGRSGCDTARVKPGELVAERFEIEARIATGGMGVVYRARDRVHGGHVAIKVLLGDQTDVAAAKRFDREARILLGLRHDHIVRYVAHGVADDGVPYLAMEWLAGEDLTAQLARGPLGIASTIRLLDRIAGALAVAHASGIAHRDIKPSNIFLRGGLVDNATLIDFGLAYVLERSERFTLSGAVLGTIGYMAPEQTSGTIAGDARGDVFALGCVAYHCLTGEPPFPGKDLRSVLVALLLQDSPNVRTRRPEVPPDLAELVARMLEKSPAARPRDAAAIREALARLGASSGEPETAPRDVLGRDERIVRCVVIASPPGGSPAETVALTASLTNLAREHEAVLHRLADGAAVLVPQASGVATDQAATAARCALALRGLLPEWAIALAADHNQPHIRSFGELGKRALALLSTTLPMYGAALNHGSRAIHVDETAAGLLSSRFEIEADGGLRLVGERARDWVPRTLLGRSIPFVGRGRELELVRALARESIAERVAHVVLVTAPAGAGKSRFRAEVVAAIEAESGAIEILVGCADAIRAGSSYAALAPIVRGAAGVFDAESPVAVARKLRNHVAQLQLRKSGTRPMDMDTVVDFLGELVGAPSDRKSAALATARRDARVMSDRIREAFLAWLAAECDAHPMLVVLEDLHWGDAPSISLIDEALRMLHDRALLVLALARPEIEDRFPRLWSRHAVQHLRLPPLATTACEQIARAALAEHGGELDELDELVEAAGGNPLHLEELIRARADGRREAPKTLIAMVQARLEMLGVDVRRVLRGASVFGETFWQAGVAELVPTPRLDEELAQLCADDILVAHDHKRSGDRAYGFRHALVREAAYGMLTDDDRRTGHRLAAAWLERVGETDATVIARHLEASGDCLRAADWYRRAAERALEGNDLDVARDRIAHAIECGAEGEVLGGVCFVRAVVWMWEGEIARALQDGRRAYALLPIGSRLSYGAACVVVMVSGMRSQADADVALALKLLEFEPGREDLALYGRAVWGTTGVFHVAGFYDVAGKLLARAERILGAVEDDPVAHGWLSLAQGYRAAYVDADPWQHFALASQAVDQFAEVGDAWSAYVARYEAGFALSFLGDYGRSIRQLVELIDEGSGPVIARGFARVMLARVHASSGDVHAARRYIVAELAVSDDWVGERMLREALAVVLVRARAWDEAERAIAALLELVAVFPTARVGALALRARVMLETGRAEPALASATEAMDLLTTLGSVAVSDAAARLVYAEAARACHGRDAAVEPFRRARERLLERAGRIPEPWRTRFLQDVPENARTLVLARELD